MYDAKILFCLLNVLYSNLLKLTNLLKKFWAHLWFYSFFVSIFINRLYFGWLHYNAMSRFQIDFLAFFVRYKICDISWLKFYMDGIIVFDIGLLS